MNCPQLTHVQAFWSIWFERSKTWCAMVQGIQGPVWPSHDLQYIFEGHLGWHRQAIANVPGAKSEGWHITEQHQNIIA